jgi:hypothetical protein
MENEMRLLAPPCALFGLVAVFVSSATFAQTCPPRQGAPPNWCVPRSKYGVPNVPLNNFVAPPVQNNGVNQQTYVPQPSPGYVPQPNPGYVPQPNVGYNPPPAGVPAPPPNPSWGSGSPPPSVTVQCFVDQVNFCNVSAPYMPPSGTSCYCGNYPGVTP